MKEYAKQYNKSILLVLLFLCACFTIAIAQEWQWSTPIKGKNGPARAFLWISQACKKVQGIVVAQHNMKEISILKNPVFRKALSELNFAEVWVSPSFNHTFNFKEGAGEIFNAFMDSLASVSGYTELHYAPVVPIGHSAAASWPYYFAAWNPQRTLACISVSGQWPYFRHPSYSPDIWRQGVCQKDCQLQKGNYLPCIRKHHKTRSKNCNRSIPVPR